MTETLFETYYKKFMEYLRDLSENSKTTDKFIKEAEDTMKIAFDYLIDGKYPAKVLTDILEEGLEKLLKEGVIPSKKVIITGASNGIGKAAAEYFILKNYEVIGMDKEPSSINSVPGRYKHYQLDLRDAEALPDLKNIAIIINNAGTQNSEDDIGNNLKTAYNVTEKYAFQESIKAVLFLASASAHTGFEFPLYSASKAGMIGYMKNVAWRLAKDPYRAVCNSLSCGGVLTDLNKPVTRDLVLWRKIMEVTPLKRWASTDEIAKWIYFLTVENKFATGQDFLVDGGEKDCNCTFVWPDF